MILAIFEKRTPLFFDCMNFYYQNWYFTSRKYSFVNYFCLSFDFLIILLF